MNKLKFLIFFLAFNLWNLGFFEPLASNIGGEVTLAEAHHKPWLPAVEEAIAKRTLRNANHPPYRNFPFNI